MVCGRPKYCKGYCMKHYGRFHKYGDPLVVRTTWDTRRHSQRPAIRHPVGYAVIPLTRGKFAKVDYDDVDRLATMGDWHFSNGYALHNVPGRTSQVRMHRVIMDAPDDKQIDHINGDKLDNRRENLRLATNAENQRNTKRRSDNTSGYKGVWQITNGRWRARLAVDGRDIHLGYFDTAEEAAAVRDVAALKYHGEFARTNAA